LKRCVFAISADLNCHLMLSKQAEIQFFHFEMKPILFQFKKLQ